MNDQTKHDGQQRLPSPVAWVRFCSDGGIEGPILDSDSRMDGVRRTSGAWTPLYTAKPEPVNQQLLAALKMVMKANDWHVESPADTYGAKAYSSANTAISAAESERPVLSGPVMHMPSGVAFDEVIAAANPGDLVALTPQSAEAAHPVAVAPVDGDLLPAIGDTVLIHLSSPEGWFPHRVVGYYVWKDHGGSKSLHRVFVRVADVDGHLNARPLDAIRRVGEETDQQPASAQPVVVPDGYAQGVEAVAKMLEKKADDFASENGYDDMGGLSFGGNLNGELMRDYHSGLLELAEEVRAMKTNCQQPASAQPVAVPDGKQNIGTKPVNGSYFLCQCDKCGWLGSSEETRVSINHGYGDGDYYCPVCGTIEPEEVVSASTAFNAMLPAAQKGGAA